MARRPGRARPDRDHDRDAYIAPAAPRAVPQAHVSCGCSCGTCQSGHCHNAGTGCNVR